MSTLLKATGIWFFFVIAAIFNGFLREKILLSVIGIEMALPISGVLLAILVFLVTLLSVSIIRSSQQYVYILIGILWVVLTLSFEFIFGHYAMGKPWQEIFQVFNIQKGDLFVLVLLVTAISPWAAGKIRGYL